jgi:hypothetical protein
MKPYNPTTMTPEEEAHWKAFGGWLKSERKRRRVSRRVLCENELVSIRPVQLQRIEEGETRTRRIVVEGIARALNLDENEALSRAGFLPTAAGSENAKLLSELMTLPPESQEFISKLVEVLKGSKRTEPRVVEGRSSVPIGPSWPKNAARGW